MGITTMWPQMESVFTPGQRERRIPPSFMGRPEWEPYRQEPDNPREKALTGEELPPAHPS